MQTVMIVVVLYLMQTASLHAFMVGRITLYCPNIISQVPFGNNCTNNRQYNCSSKASSIASVIIPRLNVILC